ncbi:patatin-like phospholipase family protein [Spirochaetota bacterium]
MSLKKGVGLVLGSGSSRGWAHIGAIEALEEEKIPIDHITGCSIGSYVAAIYASGGLKSLKKFVLNMNGKKVFSYFDVVFPKSGLLNGTKKLKELFSMHSNAQLFSDLDIPVMMVATDIDTGRKVVIRSGNLLPAMRATMSMPILFPPVKIKGRWLADGGLVDPVPVGVARTIETNIIIAIDLNGDLISKKIIETRSKKPKNKSNILHNERNELIKKLSNYYESAESLFKKKAHELLKRESATPNIIETATKSLSIMQERITRINLAAEPPDILIQPRLGELKMMDFDQVEHVIEEGYISIKERVDDIKLLLGL